MAQSALSGIMACWLRDRDQAPMIACEMTRDKPTPLLQTTPFRTTAGTAGNIVRCRRFLAAILLCPVWAVALDHDQHLTIEVVKRGVQGVTHAKLVELGWPQPAVPNDRMQLRRYGRQVSFRTAPDETRFGPGSTLLFAAHGIGREEKQLYHYSNREAFQLSLLGRDKAVTPEAGSAAEKGAEPRPAPPLKAAKQSGSVVWRQEWEENRLLVAGKQGDARNWVWQKLHQYY